MFFNRLPSNPPVRMTPGAQKRGRQSCPPRVPPTGESLHTARNERERIEPAASSSDNRRGQQSGGRHFRSRCVPKPCPPCRTGPTSIAVLRFDRRTHKLTCTGRSGELWSQKAYMRPVSGAAPGSAIAPSTHSGWDLRTATRSHVPTAKLRAAATPHHVLAVLTAAARLPSRSVSRRDRASVSSFICSTICST